ncbi:carbohydrate sulfotransferase 11-like [Mya arenaria]|uniref:carbohydrate sulfotransferase 11-like n=1 Tax=Mya arenaria TaxID=6604 RepID=UPI0022E29388|nr:carbohydrate sulfotransferase 11-like [Mya arenaria]
MMTGSLETHRDLKSLFMRRMAAQMFRKAAALGIGLVGFFSLTLFIMMPDTLYRPKTTKQVLPEFRYVAALNSVQLERLYAANLTEVARENEHRLSHVQHVCRNRREIREAFSIGEMWASPRHSIAFCVVPKVGCTYWKRIFRFIEKDYSDAGVNAPSDIDRISVHYDKLSSVVRVDLRNPGDENNIVPALKFMYTRDPYERIWSAYLDKYFLPDFWHRAKGVAKALRPNVTSTSLKCGNDVTFAELLEYIVNNRHFTDSERRVNEHFQPTVFSCNPCKYPFDIIGKAETFAKDEGLILASAWLLGKVSERKHSDRVLTEVNSLVDYNLDIKDKLNVYNNMADECFSFIDVSRRLWKVFQFNGYIGDEVHFPDKKFDGLQDKDAYKKKLKEIIFELRKKAETDTLNKWKLQRKNSVQEAFRTLPATLIANFTTMFSYDFELYQYEKHPDWLHRNHV